METLFQLLFKYKPFLFQKGRISFESAPPSWLLLLLLVALILAVYSYYRQDGSSRQVQDRPYGRGLLLICLRTLVFLVLLAILFRPTLSVSTLFPRENIAVLMIDDSKSMTIEDVNGQSRSEAIKQFLSPDHGSFLEDVGKRFQTRLFRFSRDTQKLSFLEGLQADGTGTSLEAALEGLLREFGSSPLASVVVFSDGADNLSKNLAAVLNQYKAKAVSINVCAVGQADIDKDVELVQVSSPQTLLPDSISTAVASLKSNGYAGRTAVLELKENGKLVDSKAVTLGAKEETQIVEFNLAPKGKGLKSYTVSMAPQPGEWIALNNSQDLLLNVEDSKPKILYLEGSPRWEFKFIRQAIDQDKNLQLMTLLRTSGNKFYRQGVESEDNLASGFPNSKEELFQYKGLIIGSVEASFFSSEQLRMIADFVSERGGGFMMLGGKNSFDGGKYANTPIADILPVVLGQRDSNNSYLREPVLFKLTPHGKSHLVTRLVIDETQNQKRWNSLPEIGEFNWISSVKPGATALAYGERGRNNPILLAAHRYGRGRAVAFMAASSWQWQMEMPHEDESHEVFWRQALRWLVGSSPNQVTLELDRGVYQEEDLAHLNVEVNDPAFTKLNDAEVLASITSPSGKTTENIPLKWIVSKDGIYSGQFKPTERGIYHARVLANQQGKEVGKAEQFFMVTDSNLEFYNAGQNKELLSRLAAETGGKYYALADAKSLPEEMTYMERPNSVPQTLPLWDMPAFFLLLCILLTAEWALRRRKGLA